MILTVVGMRCVFFSEMIQSHFSLLWPILFGPWLNVSSPAGSWITKKLPNGEMCWCEIMLCSAEVDVGFPPNMWIYYLFCTKPVPPSNVVIWEPPGDTSLTSYHAWRFILQLGRDSLLRIIGLKCHCYSGDAPFVGLTLYCVSTLLF